VTRVNATLLRSLVDSGYIPVVATVATDESGQALNVNADTAAGEIAAALQAEKLILMTDVPGVLQDKDDVSTKYAELNIKRSRELMQEGIIAGGMIPKVGWGVGGGRGAWAVSHAQPVCALRAFVLTFNPVPSRSIPLSLRRAGPVLRALHQPGRQRDPHHRRPQPPLHPHGAADGRGRRHADHGVRAG
jgi:hypothetical protein